MCELIALRDLFPLVFIQVATVTQEVGHWLLEMVQRVHQERGGPWVSFEGGRFPR